MWVVYIIINHHSSTIDHLFRNGTEYGWNLAFIQSVWHSDPAVIQQSKGEQCWLYSYMHYLSFNHKSKFEYTQVIHSINHHHHHQTYNTDDCICGSLTNSVNVFNRIFTKLITRFSFARISSILVHFLRSPMINSGTKMVSWRMKSTCKMMIDER